MTFFALFLAPIYLFDDEEELDQEARDILTREGGGPPTEAQVRLFKPLLLEATREAFGDIALASKGKYKPNPKLEDLPKERVKPKIDIVEAFESYCSQPRIKGGLHGPTAKRWRLVTQRFAAWIKHRDLARVTPQDAVRWRNHLLSQGISPKAVRDVWLAAPRSVATHMLNAPRLEINPFAGIKVEGVKAWKEDDERGFDPDQALAILSATVATPSHLISVEMKAARRWAPWICAYSGARVNEITSLLPSDKVGKLARLERADKGIESRHPRRRVRRHVDKLIGSDEVVACRIRDLLTPALPEGLQSGAIATAIFACCAAAILVVEL
jgi:hypothetical protein